MRPLIALLEFSIPRILVALAISFVIGILSIIIDCLITKKKSVAECLEMQFEHTGYLIVLTMLYQG